MGGSGNDVLAVPMNKNRLVIVALMGEKETTPGRESGVVKGTTRNIGSRLVLESRRCSRAPLKLMLL